MTVTSFFAIISGDDSDRGGRGLFDLGAGGSGLEGGFISKVERDRAGSTGD